MTRRSTLLRIAIVEAILSSTTGIGYDASPYGVRLTAPSFGPPGALKARAVTSFNEAGAKTRTNRQLAHQNAPDKVAQRSHMYVARRHKAPRRQCRLTRNIRA